MVIILLRIGFIQALMTHCLFIIIITNINNDYNTIDNNNIPSSFYIITI